jgi:hypothetical protein
MHSVARKIDGREIIIDSGSPRDLVKSKMRSATGISGRQRQRTSWRAGSSISGQTRNYIARLDTTTGLLVVGAAERDELVKLRQEALHAMAREIGETYNWLYGRFYVSERAFQ